MMEAYPLRYLVTLAFLCLQAYHAAAQLTMSEFIGSAFQDHEVRTFDDQVSYLGKRTYRLPPLRQMEFRFQNRELLDTQNEYALRINPANPWEMRATSKYYRSVRDALSLERELAFKEALVDRYLTILDYLYYRELNGIMTEGQAVLEKQLSILEAQSGSRYFDPDDYAKLVVDQLDYEARNFEYAYEIDNQVSRIARLYPKAHRREVNWLPEQLIPVERIQAVVDSLTTSSTRSAFVAFQRRQINVAKNHYNLEKSNINIGFGQLEYDFRRYHQERTPVNFAFGVTIPIMNPNKPDMARRQLRLIEAEYDAMEAEQETHADIVIHQEKLMRLIKNYGVLKTRIAELERGNLGQTLSTMKGGDPLLFVQFNERIRKLGTILAKIRNDIMVAYIEYLAFSDRLQQQPLTNFLSSRLEVIDLR